MKSNPKDANPAGGDAQGKAGPEAAGSSRLAGRLALTGFLLYAVFAPHSIAGAEIALILVGAALALRALTAGRAGLRLRRTPVDLPLILFLAWTLLSSLLSAEPRVSIMKLQAALVVLLFYLTRALITGRSAVMVAALMITSAAAGVAWGAVDLARGRGVMIDELSPESPFHQFQIGEGDAVWRVRGERVSAVAEIDEAIRRTPAGERLPVSLIARGEHGERPGFVVTDEMKARASPSGIRSSGPTHRFRASGWTRHYETFSETLQMLAQLSLGFGLARLRRRTGRRWAYLALAACAVLATGIIMTAMRTVLVALGVGASVIALRATRGRARLLAAAAIALVLGLGALAVWRTRAGGALLLEDYSSSLRLSVARVGLARLMIHPVFGHGMDAVKMHWTEWGFPGSDMIHMHSTPLQVAFDRGLPALVFWLWMMWACWAAAARGERLTRELQDADRHGLLLGATGAVAGFFASSLVNYNFGDAEVALIFWWLMGTVVALAPKEQ